MTDWMITPRDRDLGCTLDPIAGWKSLTLIERIDGLHTWTLTGPAHAVDVFEPGMGVILDRDGHHITSGRMWSYGKKGSVDPKTGAVTEEVTIGFIANTALLATRSTWQNPTHAIGATLATVGREYDIRTGTREDLIIAYINANLGPGALPDRRLASLAMPESRGRGGTTTVSARMNNLSVLVSELAESGDLMAWIERVDTPTGPRLELVVRDRPDVSSEVAFGPPGTEANSLVTSWEYLYQEPKVTRSIVAAAGEGTERLYATRRDTAAENLWNLSVERPLDQRQTNIQAEADTAMDDDLADGTTVSAVTFAVTDTADVKYRRDYAMGSRVGLLLPGLPASMATAAAREATTTVTVSGSQATESVSVVIGSAGATGTSTADAEDLTRALQAIRNMEGST